MSLYLTVIAMIAATVAVLAIANPTVAVALSANYRPPFAVSRRAYNLVLLALTFLVFPVGFVAGLAFGPIALLPIFGASCFVWAVASVRNAFLMRAYRAEAARR